MKKSLLLVSLLLAADVAAAAPSCWAAQIGGKGSLARTEEIAPTSETPIGMGAVDVLWWFCDDPLNPPGWYVTLYCPV